MRCHLTALKNVLMNLLTHAGERILHKHLATHHTLFLVLPASSLILHIYPYGAATPQK